jgi:hypothetical protein
MKEQEFIELAKKKNLYVKSEIGERGLRMMNIKPNDHIYHTNNTGLLFERLVNQFSDYCKNENKSIVLVNVLVEENAFFSLNEYFISTKGVDQRPFTKNYLIGEVKIDNSGRGDIESEIIKNPRIVFVQDFQFLSDNIQRSLLIDVVNSFPRGNSKEFDKLGFIRTEQDTLIMAVNLGSQNKISRNVSSRCQHFCIYVK